MISFYTRLLTNLSTPVIQCIELGFCFPPVFDTTLFVIVAGIRGRDTSGRTAEKRFKTQAASEGDRSWQEVQGRKAKAKHGDFGLVPCCLCAETAIKTRRCGDMPDRGRLWSKHVAFAVAGCNHGRKRLYELDVSAYG